MIALWFYKRQKCEHCIFILYFSETLSQVGALFYRRTKRNSSCCCWNFSIL